MSADDSYWTNWLPNATSALGIARGAASGKPLGQVRAGLQATNLASRLSGTGANIPATGALDALGIYSGINQGGVEGYGRAGASGLQLAGLLADNPALSTAGGAILAPLDAYDEYKNWRSGATGSDALSGAQTGAAIGSVVPGIGTAIGGVIGGAAGALSSAFGPGAKDPETYAVQNVIDATAQHQNDPSIAAQAPNPYLELAGLMDRRSSTLPEYAQYGRMGEQKFTNDLVSQINDAVKTNPALAKDPNAVYSQVVAPWVSKMGSGYSNVGQEYTATNQGLLQDLTNQYLGGQAAQDWKAVGGDSPFANIYQNSPIQQESQTPGQSANPIASAPVSANAPTNNLRPMLRAIGGTVSYRDALSKLRQAYAKGGGVRTFDDGGGVTGDGSTGYNWLPSIDPIFPSDATPGVSSPTPSILSDSDLTTSPNSNNSTDSSSSIFGQGGALSGLGSALGVSSLGQLLQKYGALAPLISAALGGNKSASAPSTPAGYGAIPSIPTPSYSRPYTQPNVANWYTYGQGPEQSFFGNNQLPNVPGVSPTSPPPAQSPTMTAPYLGNGSPIVRAEGGSTFDSTQGDSYVSDQGHGDGTSDPIDAKLSPGEYVMDGGTVSLLGNGSNEAGARALDQLRQRVRQHAGKHLVKGKQFMKAKAPEAYLKGGKAS